MNFRFQDMLGHWRSNTRENVWRQGENSPNFPYLIPGYKWGMSPTDHRDSTGWIVNLKIVLYVVQDSALKQHLLFTIYTKQYCI